jgi:hypothetical protein
VNFTVKNRHGKGRHLHALQLGADSVGFAALENYRLSRSPGPKSILPDVRSIIVLGYRETPRCTGESKWKLIPSMMSKVNFTVKKPTWKRKISARTAAGSWLGRFRRLGELSLIPLTGPEIHTTGCSFDHSSGVWGNPRCKNIRRSPL